VSSTEPVKAKSKAFDIPNHCHAFYYSFCSLNKETVMNCASQIQSIHSLTSFHTEAWTRLAGRTGKLPSP